MNMVVLQNVSDYHKADVTVVVDRFYVSLYRFALCLTASHPDAARLVHRAFVAFTQRTLQIHEYSKIKCWLFAAVHRYYLLEISSRRARLKTEVVLDVHNSILRNPERSGFPVVCELPAALALVNETCRPALTLFYLEDFSVCEIAHILEIPIDAVRSRLVKGKVQLRLILKTDGGPRAVSAY